MLKHSAKSLSVLLHEFQNRYDLTIDQAAHVLGMSPRMFTYYKAGQFAPKGRRLNKHMELIKAADHRLQRALEKNESIMGLINPNVTITPKNLKLAERVKELRHLHSLTQVQFAASINITQPALSLIEAGGGISEDTLSMICRKYNVTASWLTGDDVEVKHLHISSPESDRESLAKDKEIEYLKREVELLRELLEIKKSREKN